ncbi:hypothetical protein [Winogradskya humida]|nr:hypothetical protein [Actinoplanes humidus]
MSGFEVAEVMDRVVARMRVRELGQCRSQRSTVQPSAGRSGAQSAGNAS